MRKLISALLALIMVLSMATVAFAADTAVDPSGWVSDAQSRAITLNKVYTVTGKYGDADLYPAETLKFAVAKSDKNPDDTLVTVDDLIVTGSTAQTIKINLPVYSKVGVYEYTITEVEGNSQAVGYTKAGISVKVLVSYDYNNKKLVSEIVLNTPIQGGKLDTFTNTYDVGHLNVKKTISGNLADSSVEFQIDVTLNAAEPVRSPITVAGASDNVQTIAAGDGWTTKTVTVKLHADEEVNFYNIPAGVTYTVIEKEVHKLADGATLNPNSAADEEYAVTGEVTDEVAITSNATKEVVINNHKDTSVETGITMDSAPFVLMLAICAVAAVMFVIKRRSVEF